MDSSDSDVIDASIEDSESTPRRTKYNKSVPSHWREKLTNLVSSNDEDSSFESNRQISSPIYIPESPEMFDEESDEPLNGDASSKDEAEGDSIISDDPDSNRVSVSSDSDDLEVIPINPRSSSPTAVVSVSDSDSDDSQLFTTPPDSSMRLSMKTPQVPKIRNGYERTPSFPAEGSQNLLGASCAPTPTVDLTQDSVKSLENSPVAAMHHREASSNLEDVVVKISAVNHDINAKELILETVQLEDLPDNGKNLKKQIAHLKAQKSVLENELLNSKEYSDQINTINNFTETKPIGSIKQELVDESESSEPGEEFSEEVHVSMASPDKQTVKVEVDESRFWGGLPQPNMTLSGLGQRALQTHYTEKSLTVETLSTLHKDLKSCPSEDTLAEDPKGLKVELMPHQQHAVAWMLWREQGEPSGGILADDMGLGKTLSMISLILKDIQINEDQSYDSCESSDDESPVWLNSKHPKMYKGGTLVVCPASLVAQWDREIYKRTKKGLLSRELYHGNNREMRPRKLAKADVVITTYHLVGREAAVETPKTATVPKEKGPLFYIQWDRVILDEAHIVRNHKSVMAQGVCDLVAKHRWCLTGTPIHNKQLDLYALLKFLRCSPFDELSIWKRWVDNKHEAGMQRLNTMMKTLLLRRTKDQLQLKGELRSLPEKTYETVYVSLDDEELDVYEKIAEYSRSLFAQFLGQRAEKQQMLDARYGFSTMPAWQQQDRPTDQFKTTEELAHLHRRMQGLTEIKTFQILILLLRLRQACCHPNLVTEMVKDGDIDSCEGSEPVDDNLLAKMDAMTITAENPEPVFSEEFIAEEKMKRARIMSTDNPVFSLDRPSSKVRAALEILEEKVLGTDKAIIVSQWTSFLKIILKYLTDKGVNCATLSGEIPVLKRQDIVDSFNRSGSGPQVLLLSLTAGGVGLNLVGANHLLLVDIHWNPQLEAQACDRIYRVGQKKPVSIYRFITNDTIEERVKTMQEVKLALAEDVLTGTKNYQASKLTLDDLKMLFNMGAPMPHLPKA